MHLLQLRALGVNYNQVTPFADQIISFLPSLWDQAGEEFLMKQSILGILSSLISAMRSNSRHYHSLIIPLIESSVKIDSETRIYLLEDALDLWATVLQQTPSDVVPDVLPLVPHLFPMLEVGSDSLRKALEMTETYVYLAPLQMLPSSGLLLPAFVSLLEGAKREATGPVLSTIDLLIQSALELGGNEAFMSLMSQLLEFKFLQTVLSGLHGAHEAHQASGPNRSKTWLDVLTETDYLSILSRIVLASPNIFVDAVKAAKPDDEFDFTIKWLLSEWFRHFDNISQPEKRKLNCLGLTALMQTGQPWILEHLQELMGIWTETVLELYDDDNSKGDDYLVYKDHDALKATDETAEQEGHRKVRCIP